MQVGSSVGVQREKKPAAAAAAAAAAERNMGLLPLFSLETWILLVTLVCVFVTYSRWTFGTFERLGVPGSKPQLLFGTIAKHNKVYYLADHECTQKYGRVWGMFEFRKPLLAVTDPDALKTILVKECFTHFPNRRSLPLSGELYDAVSIAEDDTWRRIRNVLSPMFTSGHIKEMFSVMKRHSRKLTDRLSSKVHDGEALDIKSFFGPYAMDVIMSCALSVDMDTINNPSSPLIGQASQLFNMSIPLYMFQACFPVFLPLLKLLDFSIFPRSSTEYFKKTLNKILAERDGSSTQVSEDFLQHMINSRTPGKSKRNGDNKGLSDHEIFTQATIFVFAGYETSALTLVFLAYNLARNPEAMRRLQEEIDSTFPNKGSVQYEALMQMEYLDGVVSESLRLYPVVPRLERTAKETVKINGITIPKDMVVMVPVYALHRDPELWPEPEEFKPDRFTKEKKQSMNPYTYLPFGVGPRNCLGMRFALVMVKLALVEVLQNYSFLVCEETEYPLQMSPVSLLGPLQPIKLKVVARADA